MMRTIRTGVVGMSALLFAVCWAAAGQPAPDRAVEPVRFVAPDPTLSAEVSASRPRVSPQTRVGGEMGYARADDASPGAPHDDASLDFSGDTACRAAAGQPAPADAVEPVRFVAPDPTPSAAVPTAMPRAVPESASGAGMGYAFADDATPDAPTDTAGPDVSGDAALSTLPSDHDLPPYADSMDYSMDDHGAPPADYTIMYGGRARPRRTCRVIGSTCTMGQHHAYFPPMHGYYYFHPYHHSHVWRHQAFAQLWGEDPAHPYANRVFEMVYEQYRAEALPEQPFIED